MRNKYMKKFQLLRIDANTFVCKDNETGIACTFERGAFNETQLFTIEGDASKDINILARASREIGGWLTDNFPQIVEPINHRERVGKEIKRLRIEQGLTQAELGEKAGIHGSHITRIEAGRYSVSFDILQRIAAALGCNVAFIEDNDDLLAFR